VAFLPGFRESSRRAKPHRLKSVLLDSLRPGRHGTFQFFQPLQRPFPVNSDGSVTRELGVVRAIHLAHSARANLPDDFVGIETCAGDDRHGLLPNQELAEYTLDMAFYIAKFLIDRIARVARASQAAIKKVPHPFVIPSEARNDKISYFLRSLSYSDRMRSLAQCLPGADNARGNRAERYSASND
jgi:hypothetical protein